MCGVMVTDFASDVALNPVNRAILSRWRLLDLPDAWLVAGCLVQTVSPNPATPYPEVFASKVASYQARWNWLHVAPV
jgi:hypothetical protein